MASAKYAMIVMYHYVRRIAGSPFPGIKGRETEEFAAQIAYLARRHRIVGLERVIAACHGEDELPANAVVLTFDDGYQDHYSNAFPILRKAGVTGTFFVPECAVSRHRMLDVNKVHFLLARAARLDAVVAEIDRRVAEANDAGIAAMRTLTAYRAEFHVANRFDPPDVIYIKRMLQHALPDAVRLPLLDELFHRWVSADQADFAATLYMSEAELKEMLAAGMLVGAHGANHLWMDRCDIPAQRAEVDLSAELLTRLGVPRAAWSFCYPYGAYNLDTLALVRQRGFRAGVTTALDLLDSAACDPLLMPRLDTNDLPVSQHAEANSWSRRLIDSTAE